MFGIPLHKLIVHFPIALTIVALIYDGWGVYAKRTRLHETGYGLSLWAAATGLAAVTTGLMLAGVSRIESGALTGHTGFGLAAGIALTMLGFWRYSANMRNVKDYQSGWLVLQVAATILVIAAAVTGHRLLY